MVTLHRYHVVPALPPEIAALSTLGRNLWWTWNRPVRELFVRIDGALYESVAQNPLALLARVGAARLEELARDAGFVAAVDEQNRALEQYLGGASWFRSTYGDGAMQTRIAYFSMEFGIHECLPVYSGGLGVLAGDHLKSASDLGLPLVGVGVAFSLGYFRQSLDEEGWQTERYPPNDWHDLPVSPVSDASGAPIVVAVPLPIPADKIAALGAKSRDVFLAAWRVDVGRVPLLLLDADLERNVPEDRALTNTLYGGDRTHRIRQEILLGVGGVRMLDAVGLRPAVCHMNEGHSAFLAIERARQLMVEQHAPFEVATEAAAAGNVFTTHTPVPAGNDAFGHDLIAPYLELLGQGLGRTSEDMMRIGRIQPDKPGGEFSMPVLAIRMADRYNGVSVLHGREARAMWSVLWPGLPPDEVPIGSVTNGVHLGTWVAKELAELYETKLGPRWIEGSDPAAWAKMEDVPDAELWSVHERCRERLIAAVRRRLRLQAERKGRVWDASGADGLLDPRALTIGFARRFATYKRGTLLLRDPQRLERIVSASNRPVQLLFSGKAHPQDWGGKELIQGIVRASRTPQFRGHIVFVEDYDMGVARELVSGVDVWLNTPRRPLEASGTSGMKAALNGALHASVLDGWWCEAYAGDNGFAIGHGEEYADAEYGDRLEAEALYRLLEEQIVPLFYDRDAEGLPRGWIARMKRSIAGIGPVFNTARMVREYAEKAYAPAARRFRSLAEEGLGRACAIAAWKARVAAAWPSVRIERVTDRGPRQLTPGGEIAVVADVHLGSLAPADVAVELYYGKVDGHRIPTGQASPMRVVDHLAGDLHRFEGSVPASVCGEHAFAVRVIPHHEALGERFAARLLAWH